MRAIWNDTVIAESRDTVLLEGNHYFPLAAVRPDYIVASSHHTHCAWKGTAHYYDVVVDGARNPSAAWYYPTPSTAAQVIAGRVAFWHGVIVTD